LIGKIAQQLMGICIGLMILVFLVCRGKLLGPSISSLKNIIGLCWQKFILSTQKTHPFAITYVLLRNSAEIVFLE
jgi:hypothetical protein